MEQEKPPNRIITQFTPGVLLRDNQKLNAIIEDARRQGLTTRDDFTGFIDQSFPDPKVRNRLILSSAVLKHLQRGDHQLEDIREVLLWGPSNTQTYSWGEAVDLIIEIRKFNREPKI